MHNVVVNGTGADGDAEGAEAELFPLRDFFRGCSALAISPATPFIPMMTAPLHSHLPATSNGCSLPIRAHQSNEELMSMSALISGFRVEVCDGSHKDERHCS